MEAEAASSCNLSAARCRDGFEALATLTSPPTLDAARRAALERRHAAATRIQAARRAKAGRAKAIERRAARDAALKEKEAAAQLAEAR